MSKIHAKLNKIQTSLKAPKGQTNAFGKYKYRSCEDILKALTPHLEETGTAIVIDDSIEMIGDRFYVKATSTLICCESGEEVSANGYAREPLSKKGMDEAQITGSTSSYARKYSMNGLFAIDDTKDADATNTHGKSKPKQTSNPIPQQKQDDDDNLYHSMCEMLKELNTIKDVDVYAKDIAGQVGAMLPDYQIAVKEAFAKKRSTLKG